MVPEAASCFLGCRHSGPGAWPHTLSPLPRGLPGASEPQIKKSFVLLVDLRRERAVLTCMCVRVCVHTGVLIWALCNYRCRGPQERVCSEQVCLLVLSQPPSSPPHPKQNEPYFTTGGLRPHVELCVEPAGLCGRCTGVAVPLRVVPSPTGLPSKRGPGLGSFSRADRGIGGVRHVAPPTWLVSNFLVRPASS